MQLKWTKKKIKCPDFGWKWRRRCVTMWIGTVNRISLRKTAFSLSLSLNLYKTSDKLNGDPPIESRMVSYANGKLLVRLLGARSQTYSYFSEVPVCWSSRLLSRWLPYSLSCCLSTCCYFRSSASSSPFSLAGWAVSWPFAQGQSLVSLIYWPNLRFLRSCSA